jgi:hypothetical protein
LLIVDIRYLQLLPLDKPPATLASIGGCGKVIKPVNELDALWSMNKSITVDSD